MNMRTILLMNGPNLDMLGIRETAVYGEETLADLESLVSAYAGQRGIALSCFQSNSEGELINVIHHASEQFDGVVFNPGAYTHYSYAIRDAVAGSAVPFVEVHISDIDQREEFRRVSVVAPACVAQVKGLGFEGYCRAVDILCDLKELIRLGEAYERGFTADRSIRIAGQENLSVPPRAGADGPSAAAAESPAPVASNPAGSADAAGAMPEDFAEPYAQDVFAVDAASVSESRFELIRKASAQIGAYAFLVRDTSSIKWASALDGVFDEERAHALLVTQKAAWLHTDSRYSNAVRTQLARIGGSLNVSDERMDHMAFARGVLAQEGADANCRIAIEDSITYAEYVKAVQELGIQSLLATNKVMVNLRSVKTSAELSRMLAAQAVTDAAFAHIVGFMRPGMTEREVQLELEGYMLRHGAEGLAFPSIVATGPNGADPHAIPGKTQLEAGQCVVMDFGAKAFGYCSDMTRMVFLGQPDERLARAWDVLKSANESVQAQLRAGMTGKEAHEIAEQVLAQGGFEGRMGHGLGHGVGIDVHEEPLLSPKNERPLSVGNVVTVEPGIYVPGEFGMRLEDCGILTEQGYRAFSQIGHDLVVV